MSDLFLLGEPQMERIAPFFPLPQGAGGIVYVIRPRPSWKDGAKSYDPHKAPSLNAS